MTSLLKQKTFLWWPYFHILLFHHTPLPPPIGRSLMGGFCMLTWTLPHLRLPQLMTERPPRFLRNKSDFCSLTFVVMRFVCRECSDGCCNWLGAWRLLTQQVWGRGSLTVQAAILYGHWPHTCTFVSAYKDKNNWISLVFHRFWCPLTLYLCPHMFE